jgi:hypothetical protein
MMPPIRASTPSPACPAPSSSRRLASRMTSPVPSHLCFRDSLLVSVPTPRERASGCDCASRQKGKHVLSADGAEDKLRALHLLWMSVNDFPLGARGVLRWYHDAMSEHVEQREYADGDDLLDEEAHILRVRRDV